MSASRSGRRFAVATTMTGLLAAPLAVVTVAAPAHAAPVDIQILGTNDFHGRLLAGSDAAGAAQYAGAITELESQNPNTIFAAAGDLIGASTFESFIQHDKPTLDALNAAGLDVSAAGNHEFDAGYADLVNRVMQPESAANPEGGAKWQYIAANVRKKSDDSYALPDVTSNTPDANDTSDGGTWTTTVAGVEVGFIGGVTEELSALVSPDGIKDVKVNSIIAETNAAADRLKADGADLIILLVHEGAPDVTKESASSNDNAFGRIVNGVGPKVNAIISGHTHLAYNHVINGRPVVSAGQYGMNIDKLVFTVDPDTDAVTLKSNEVLATSSVTLDSQAAKDKKDEVAAIVTAASAKADVLGARELGSIAGPFDRARLASGSDNRGGESTLGNLVAEVQRWATSGAESGAAQIAFMNPGGLRDDMRGLATAGYPAKLTYKQAAVVQPFANTLVNMMMTGAVIKEVLEQQWQRDDKGAVPTRPFLRLGLSKGFFVTYDATRAEGNRVTSMTLNGKAIDPAATYSVTANAFLAAGGDNFRAFGKGTAKRDTGKVDLQAMVDYLAANASKGALAVNKDQQQVGVTWPTDAPRFYRIGQDVELSLSSLAMTGPNDARDALLNIKVGNATLNPVVVDNTLSTTPFDEAGKAAVSVKLKGKTRTGKQLLTFTGPTTGTTFSLPIDVRKAKPEVNVRVKPKRIAAGKTRTRLKIKAEAFGIKTVTGKVVVKVGGKKYTVKLKKGKAVVKLAKFAKTGTKRVKVKYAGNRKVRNKTAVVKIKVRRG